MLDDEDDTQSLLLDDSTSGELTLNVWTGQSVIIILILAFQLALVSGIELAYHKNR